MTDQDKFNKFLEVLSEDFIRQDFLMPILLEGKLARDAFAKLGHYSYYRLNLTSRFFDSEIQQYLVEFNKTFSGLFNYIVDHFPVHEGQKSQKIMSIPKNIQDEFSKIAVDFKYEYYKFLNFASEKLFNKTSLADDSNKKTVEIVYSWEFNPNKKTAYFGKKTICFKGKQLALMTLLNTDRNTVFSYDQIYKAVYGENKIATAYQKSNINKMVGAIKKKLKNKKISKQIFYRVDGYGLTQ